MKTLTPRQQQVLRFIDSFRKQTGRTPTESEITTTFNFKDLHTAHHHLQRLRRKGYLRATRSNDGGNGIITFRKGEKSFGNRRLSLFGMIPAGPLREMFDDMGEQSPCIEDLVPGIRPGDYFLIVDGDSMIDAGLHHGQYVVIRPDVVPNDGDICAVWVEGMGNTLKQIFQEGEMIRLVAANPRYRPLLFPADQVRVQGVLVAALAIQRFKHA
jgi:repressor LexA